MSRTRIVLGTLAMLSLAIVGCNTSDGSKSDGLRNWDTVNAPVVATTEAAKDVLTSEGLKDVVANSSNLEGTATAAYSNGTKVNVAIKKVTDTTCTVTVKIGMMGLTESAARKELTSKIKAKAEGMTTKTM